MCWGFGSGQDRAVAAACPFPVPTVSLPGDATPGFDSRLPGLPTVVVGRNEADVVEGVGFVIRRSRYHAAPVLSFLKAKQGKKAR